MTHYNRHRRDGCQNDIVSGLRQLGWAVYDLSQTDRFCDVIVCATGRTLCLLELKMPGEGPTPEQSILAQEWPVHCVHDLEEAISACNREVKRR